ncbi:MAG: heparinase II/III-family protein [Syntrophobacteraceae bacterium]
MEEDRSEYRHFLNSGYTVIKTSAGPRFTFDHGPLGMPPLFNHGHADALSVTLSVNGREILVDPGTYRYNDAGEWRNYFKSTRAHNTVMVDGMDQAVQETGFIWSKAYESELLVSRQTGDDLYLEAVHTGYMRLEQPVRHRRSILFSNRSVFIIKDSFEGNGTHDFELNYHFHPDVKLMRLDRWWSAENAGSKVFIRTIREEDFSQFRGLKAPLLGWYSPNYGVKLESSVLSCRKSGDPNAIKFLTVISLIFPTA